MMNSISEIISADQAVLVYFYSPGCSACKILRPKVMEMTGIQFPKVKLYEIDSSLHPELTAEVSVFAAPTILVFFEGKEYLRESKYISVDQLKEKISRYYNMLFD
ncbi:MAG: thioredoxin family protein [Bacteroidales bacterium]